MLRKKDEIILKVVTKTFVHPFLFLDRNALAKYQKYEYKSETFLVHAFSGARSFSYIIVLSQNILSSLNAH